MSIARPDLSVTCSDAKIVVGHLSKTPGASKIYLHGSRSPLVANKSRKRPTSDWDFIVETEKKIAYATSPRVAYKFHACVLYMTSDTAENYKHKTEIWPDDKYGVLSDET